MFLLPMFTTTVIIWTVLSLPVKEPFVSRYEWTIDCFLQVTGHWHQV